MKSLNIQVICEFYEMCDRQNSCFNYMEQWTVSDTLFYYMNDLSAMN